MSLFAYVLAVIAAVCAATQPAAAAFDRKDFYGNDLTSSSSRSPVDCCVKCSSTTGCKAWTYHLDSKTCHLKTGVGRQDDCDHCTSGIPEAKCSSVEQTDFYGADLSWEYALDIGHCCDLCSATSGCKAWTFHSTTGSCILKTGIERRDVGCSYCTSGVLPGFLLDVPEGECNVEEQTDFYGEDLSSGPISTPQACCDWCSLNPACKAWTYHSTTNYCFIKAGTGRREACDFCTSGVPTASIGPLPLVDPAFAPPTIDLGSSPDSSTDVPSSPPPEPPSLPPTEDQKALSDFLLTQLQDSSSGVSDEAISELSAALDGESTSQAVGEALLEVLQTEAAREALKAVSPDSTVGQLQASAAEKGANDCKLATKLQLPSQECICGGTEPYLYCSAKMFTEFLSALDAAIASQGTQRRLAAGLEIPIVDLIKDRDWQGLLELIQEPEVEVSYEACAPFQLGLVSLEFCLKPVADLYKLFNDFFDIGNALDSLNALSWPPCGAAPEDPLEEFGKEDLKAYFDASLKVEMKLCILAGGKVVDILFDIAEAVGVIEGDRLLAKLCLASGDLELLIRQDILKIKASGGIVDGMAGLDKRLNDALGTDGEETNIQLSLDASAAFKFMDASSNDGCRAAAPSKALADAIGCEEFCRRDAGMFGEDLGYSAKLGWLDLEKEGSLVQDEGEEEPPLPCVAALDAPPPCDENGNPVVPPPSPETGTSDTFEGIGGTPVEFPPTITPTPDPGSEEPSGGVDDNEDISDGGRILSGHGKDIGQ